MSQTTLCAAHRLRRFTHLVRDFAATSADVVEAVVFNGRLSTIDRATGKPDRPHLLSVEAERSIFEDLVLAAVEPARCLKRLNVLVSPNPFDMEAVEPFIAFDLKRFRFADDMDVIAAGRRNHDQRVAWPRHSLMSPLCSRSSLARFPRISPVSGRTSSCCQS
jgi:hypothetical protein